MENKFKINNKVYGVFIAEDKAIEIYEEEDPAHTGFIFNNKKEMILFINNLSDIISKEFDLWLILKMFLMKHLETKN